MPRIRDILPAVLAVRSGVIDQALSHALRYAQPDELGELASAMLNRGKANGMEALVSEFHRLPEHEQQQLISQAEDFAISIRRAATKHGPTAATNALTIIERSASTRLAYLAASLCRNADPNVRKKAGRCLVGLACRAITTPQTGEQPHLDAVSTRFLVEAIEQAVVVFSRDDQPDILQAMLLLSPRPMPEATAALSSRDHPSQAALIKLLNQSLNTATRRALLPLAACVPLVETVHSALAETNASGKLVDPLTLGHLLALPAVKKGLSKSRMPDTLWPDTGQQRSIHKDARRWLPAYLQAINPDPFEQALKLAPLAKLPDLATRHATLRRLLVIARQDPDDHRPAIDNANDTLALMTRDPEPAIARTALWHLIRAEYAGLSRILADLINSRHPTIRKVAAERLAPLGFERLWEAWPRLAPDRRLAAGRALIKIDPAFHRHIAAKLASTDIDTRLRALVVIATLNQGFFFEDVLLDLCTSEDQRIVASAVKALSGCTSDLAQQTLQLAMEHEDSRVRANALEAMSHSQTAANIDRLIEFAEDPAQRPRANAIKALLELQAKDALPSLTRMLSDRRAAHRISALWLIDELGILQLARLVAEMSLSDDDTDVKERAGLVIQHLIEDLEHQADTQEQTKQPSGAA